MGVLDQSLVRIREPSSLVGSSEYPSPPVGGAALLSAMASEVSSLTCALFDLAVPTLLSAEVCQDGSGGPGHAEDLCPQRLNSPVLTCNNSDPCGKFHAQYS